MKNIYLAPEMELISFDAKDVITTSSFTGMEEDFGWNAPASVNDGVEN